MAMLFAEHGVNLQPLVNLVLAIMAVLLVAFIAVSFFVIRFVVRCVKSDRQAQRDNDEDQLLAELLRSKSVVYNKDETPTS